MPKPLVENDYQVPCGAGWPPIPAPDTLARSAWVSTEGAGMTGSGFGVACGAGDLVWSCICTPVEDGRVDVALPVHSSRTHSATELSSLTVCSPARTWQRRLRRRADP